MAATFPGGVKTFSTKNAGDQINSAHINDLQLEVVAVETTLGANPFTWTAYTPSWTAVTTNPSIGNGTLSGRYVQIGKTVIGTIKLAMGSTTTYGSGAWSFSLPKTSAAQGGRYGGQWMAEDIGTKIYTGTLFILDNVSTVSIFVRDEAVNYLSNTTTHTWASGDYLFISFIYEAA